MDYIIGIRYFVNPGIMAINERDKVPIFMIFPQVWQRNMKKQKSVALISYLMSLPFVT